MNILPRELWEIVLNYCGDLITVDTFRILSKDCNDFIEEYFHMMYLVQHKEYTILRPDKLKYLIYFDCRSCLNNDLVNKLTKLKKLIHCRHARVENTKFEIINCSEDCYYSYIFKYMRIQYQKICLRAIKGFY